MLKSTNQVIHSIVTPVMYEVSELNLTLLPAEVQQRLNASPETTKICQGDTPVKPDGTVATFWHFYQADNMLPSEIFEGTQVADDFLAGCLL